MKDEKKHFFEKIQIFSQQDTQFFQFLKFFCINFQGFLTPTYGPKAAFNVCHFKIKLALEIVLCL